MPIPSPASLSLSRTFTLRRRRLQFRLRFLFAAILAAACVAWWFRPGIVKPKFELERYSRNSDAGYERVEAHVRLTNAGPDSIRVDRSWSWIAKDTIVSLAIHDH